VSPGAKLGSTAPYGRAELMLVEAGDRQPRSLSPAFRTPARPHLADAMAKLQTHLAWLDKTYETGERRRALHLTNEELPGAPRGSLREIAQWARATVLAGAAP
jgi:CRISPR system Cascade subunit CasC